MNETIITSLAANGPWAATAGFLLLHVIKAWTNDRQQLTDLLTEFKDTLTALTHAVQNLKS
jgi:hypothetical protein